MEFSNEQLEKLGFYEDILQKEKELLLQKAFKVIHSKVNTKCDFFSMLAATNLLNALVKQPYFKKRISYSFKRNLANILEDIITNRMTYLFDSIHYDNDCIYVRCYSLHFSFHNLLVNKNVIADLEMSGLDSGEAWDGMRLQQHAELIFDTALQLKHIRREEERLITIQKLKLSIV